MNNSEILAHCLELITAESEEAVVNLLKKWGFWDSENVWQLYGDIENNYSQIGNQMSEAEAALVEKLVNSMDALLILECLRKRINPEGPNAPNSIEGALMTFYNIAQGKLSNISSDLRTKLAENIHITATGERREPCITIIDKGEGQEPDSFPSTFLSLNKSNKIKIPFVKGQFNMGGTGVLSFCGENNLQLIVSKRHPDLLDGAPRSMQWGFTVVRRETRAGCKNSVYTYLAPENRILAFESKSIRVIPGEFPSAYEIPLSYGTIIKLYNYRINNANQPFIFDIFNKISLLLPEVTLPARFHERRMKVLGPDRTLVGLKVQLLEDNTHLEENFPFSGEMNIEGEKIEYEIYAFKKHKGKREFARKNEGIIFTRNGQTHGVIPTTFFERKSVNLGYLKDSILVLCDCSKISLQIRENLFMNSRDRLRNTDFKKKLERELQDLIKNHPGLRELQERRRREELQNKIVDSKPLKDVLEDIFKKSPELSNLFAPGVKIKHPFNLDGAATKTIFEGKEFPTYFELKLKGIKQCPLGQKFRIIYETDVKNDYLKRSNLPGTFQLIVNNQQAKDYTINLWNGRATLNVRLPESAKVGDIFIYSTILQDPRMPEPFTSEFQVKVLKAQEPKEGAEGERVKPPSDIKGDERNKKAGLSYPNIVEVRKAEWVEHNFDEFSALKVVNVGENQYDFFVNMDNHSLLTEIKYRLREDPKAIQAKYKLAMVLIGMALLKENGEKDQNQTEETSVTDEIYKITKKISPVLLPMIAYLAELE